MRACFGGRFDAGFFSSADLWEGSTMLENTHQKEIHLLEILKNSPTAGQRNMAEAVGLSLGMTNLLLKELSAKGWMLMRRLNARKVQYVLTPEGIKELSRRSYRFLKKSIRNVAEWRLRLEALVIKVQESGSKGLQLIGGSDVDFVLDYLCRQRGVPFRSTGEPDPEWYRVYGENEPASAPNILDYMDATAVEIR
jgi:predicted transcriptional regulator